MGGGLDGIHGTRRSRHSAALRERTYHSTPRRAGAELWSGARLGGARGDAAGERGGEGGGGGGVGGGGGGCGGGGGGGGGGNLPLDNSRYEEYCARVPRR